MLSIIVSEQKKVEKNEAKVVWAFIRKKLIIAKRASQENSWKKLYLGVE